MLAVTGCFNVVLGERLAGCCQVLIELYEAGPRRGNQVPIVIFVLQARLAKLRRIVLQIKAHVFVSCEVINRVLLTSVFGFPAPRQKILSEVIKSVLMT